MNEQEALSKLLVGQAELTANVHGLVARVERGIESSDEKHKVHFAERATLLNKVHGIELDYVPRASFAAHKGENRQDLDKLSTQVTSITMRLAWVFGIGATIFVLVQWYLK